MVTLDCSFVMDFPVEFTIPAKEWAAAWAFKSICGFTKEVANDLAYKLMKEASFTEPTVWTMENGEKFIAQLMF